MTWPERHPPPKTGLVATANCWRLFETAGGQVRAPHCCLGNEGMCVCASRPTLLAANNKDHVLVTGRRCRLESLS